MSGAFPWRKPTEPPEAGRDLLVVVGGKLRDDVVAQVHPPVGEPPVPDGKMWRYRENPLRPDRSAFVGKSFGNELRPSHWAYLSDVPLPGQIAAG